MKIDINNDALEGLCLHRDYLVKYEKACFGDKLIWEDAEDVVQDMFSKLIKNGTGALGEISKSSLKHYSKQKAIDFMRHRGRKIRGGGASHVDIGDVEHLLHDGGAVVEDIMNKEEEDLAMGSIERIVALVWPKLSDRERIVLELILKDLPDDSTPSELIEGLSASGRERLLPLNWRSLSEEEQEKKLLRQVRRSRWSGRVKLRKVRGEMGEEY